MPQWNKCQRRSSSLYWVSSRLFLVTGVIEMPHRENVENIWEGINSYFQRIVPVFEGVSSALLLPCISGSSLLVCMSLYRRPRKVPLNIWPVLQNRSLLLLEHLSNLPSHHDNATHQGISISQSGYEEKCKEWQGNHKVCGLQYAYSTCLIIPCTFPTFSLWGYVSHEFRAAGEQTLNITIAVTTLWEKNPGWASFKMLKSIKSLNILGGGDIRCSLWTCF